MILLFATLLIQIRPIVPAPSSVSKTSIYIHGEANPKANYRSWRAQSIINRLLGNESEYDADTRPFNGGSPVYVTTSIQVYSLSAVREALMEYRAQFRFKQQWHDDRLIFKDAYFNKSNDALHVDRNHRIWMPDTFFQNEKDGRYHELDQPNVYVLVRPDGQVIYDRRISMTFSCIMRLHRYPLDSQECVADFASYAYTDDQISYVWRAENPIEFMNQADSVLSNFIVTSYTNHSCTSNTSTGIYSCLRMTFKLQRVFSFFLLQLYVPSSLLVAVSWVSYWIDWRAAAGRVPLAIVTLLTMITQSHAVNANLPPVSYAKAIDVWVGACVMFIFGSLIEYAFVNYTGIHDQRKKAELEQQRMQAPPQSRPSPPDCVMVHQVHENRAQTWNQMTPTSPQTAAQTATPSPMTETAMLIRRSIGKSGTSIRRRRPSPAYIPWIANAESTSIDSPIITTPRQAESIPLNGFRTDLAVHFEDISDRMRLKRRRRLFVQQLPHLCRILQKRSRADRIDFVSRLLFPLLFASFNIVYWTIYWLDLLNFNVESV